ncbi:MAG: GTP-binding protein [Acidimicrobiia bacterium]
MSRPEPTSVTFVHGWLDGGAEQLGARLAAAAGPGTVVVHHGRSSLDVAPTVEVVTTGEEVGARSEGCACCAQRVDLVEVLGRIARRRRPPAHVVVVELPGADPATAVVTMLDDPDLRRLTHLNAVALAIDGPAVSAVVGDGGTTDPWPMATVLEATVLADLVWIAGGDRLTHQGVRLAAAPVRRVNPEVSLDASSAPRLDHLLRARAWSPASARRRLDRCGPARRPVAAHPAGTAPTTGATLLDVDGELDPDRLEAWIHVLHGAAGARLLRVDGVLALAGDEHRTHVVGCRASLHHEPGAPWAPGEARRSRLRLAGRDLDLGDLGAQLDACRAS